MTYRTEPGWTIYEVIDDDGRRMDAHFEIRGSFVIFQSRGGRKNEPRSSNTDYGTALRLILQRLKAAGHWVQGAWVESRAVRGIPEHERQILYAPEFSKSPDEVFTWMSARMRGIGSSAARGGNSTKRIKLSVLRSDGSPQLFLVLGGRRVHPTDTEKAAESLKELSQEDRQWAEGNVRLRQHLDRERASGLPEAKKEHFRSVHGSLFCEDCGFDPVKQYGGAIGEACIEVHHAAVQVSEMTPNHASRLSDLKCLCANCHRVTHRMIREARRK